MNQRITICRIVVYTLSASDVAAIVAQRESQRASAGFRGRMSLSAGLEYPAIVVGTNRDREPSSTALTANLQVFLDANDTFWAHHINEGTEPGRWHWPVREADVDRSAESLFPSGAKQGPESGTSSAAKAVVGVASVRVIPMPRYRCHKEVSALKIKVICDLGYNKGAEITPFNAEFSPFKVDKDYVAKHQPQPGGYYVVYEDGYKSFSPEKAFEEGYTLIP